MPRRTPIKELQETEETPVGSPLRRSTRILTRRTSTETSNNTPVTAKTRRSSFTSDAAEQKTTAEKEVKSTPIRGRRASKSEDGEEGETLSARRTTRSSSITKETIPTTPTDPKRITRSSSLTRTTEAVTKPIGRRRSASIQEVIYEEITTEENKGTVEDNAKEEETGKKDLNLSIIEENNENEKIVNISSDKENVSPEKQKEQNVFQPKLSDSVIANLTMEPMEVDEENSFKITEAGKLVDSSVIDRTVIKNACIIVEKLNYDIENASNLIQEDKLTMETEKNTEGTEEDVFLSDFVDKVQGDELKSKKDDEDKNESESEKIEFEILSEEEEKITQIEDKNSIKKSNVKSRLSLRKVELKLLSDNEEEDEEIIKQKDSIGESNESEGTENRSNNSICFNDTKIMELGEKISNETSFDFEILSDEETSNKETDKAENIETETEVRNNKETAEDINDSFNELQITQQTDSDKLLVNKENQEVNESSIKINKDTILLLNDSKPDEDEIKTPVKTPKSATKKNLEHKEDPLNNSNKKETKLKKTLIKRKESLKIEDCLEQVKTAVNDVSLTKTNDEQKDVLSSEDATRNEENRTPIKENEKEYDDYNSPIKLVNSLKSKRSLMESDEEESEEKSFKFDDSFVTKRKKNAQSVNNSLNDTSLKNSTIEENSKEISEKEPCEIKKKRYSLDKTAELKLDKLIEENILNDATETTEDEEEGNEFIDDMAEEGEEDTPSEDSNDIIEVGEKINTTDSEWSDSEDYLDEGDSDGYSFIDDGETELLSGNEYDLELDSEKKSRFLSFSSEDEGNEIIKLVSKSKKLEQKPKSRIIQLQDSSDEDVNDNGEIKKNEETSTEESEEKISEGSPVKKIEELNQLNKEDPFMKNEKVITPKKLEGDSVKKNEENISFNKKEESLIRKNEDSPKKSSIIIHENIRIDEIKDKDFTDRINSVVELFCAKINKKGEVKLNVSLDYAEKSSDDDLKQKETKENIEEVKSFEKDGKKKKRRNRKKKLKQEIVQVEKIEPNKLEKSTQNLEKPKSKLLEKQNKKSEKIEKKPKKRFSDEVILNEPKKKKAKFNLDEMKSFKTNKTLKTSPKQELKTKTLSILNELIMDQKEKKTRNTKLTNIDGWMVENCTKVITPSTTNPKINLKQKLIGNIKTTKSEDEGGAFHAKDFKNRMLYDTSRVKRCDTKSMMKKRGVLF